MTLDHALERAYRQRPDYLAALDRVRAAEASRRAVVGEGLPSFKLRADYGTIGLTLSTSLPTFNVTGAVDVPIFEGGRQQGRLAEADAELRERRAEAEDMKTEVYYDVRSAFLDLQSTEEELQAATRAQGAGRAAADAVARSLCRRRRLEHRGRAGAGGSRAGQRAVHQRAIRLQPCEGHARALARIG